MPDVLPGRCHHHLAGKNHTGHRIVGLSMKNSAKKYIVTALLLFVALPMLLFYVGDIPARSILKDSISILTIIAFSLMLQQFFLSRHFKPTADSFRLSQISTIHKVIGYSIGVIFLLHPLLLILPRFFEAGVEPLDALITILTNFESLGIVLGLAAWGLMLLLGLTALLRYRLVKWLGFKYRSWRFFHGSLSIVFISVASWHAIDLGRHTHLLMAVFVALAVLIGSALFASHYLSKTLISPGAK